MCGKPFLEMTSSGHDRMDLCIGGDRMAPPALIAAGDIVVFASYCELHASHHTTKNAPFRLWHMMVSQIYRSELKGDFET